LEHAPENLVGMVAISQPPTDSKCARWQRPPAGLLPPSRSVQAEPYSPLDAMRRGFLRPMIDALTRVDIACRYLGNRDCRYDTMWPKRQPPRRSPKDAKRRGDGPEGIEGSPPKMAHQELPSRSRMAGQGASRAATSPGGRGGPGDTDGRRGRQRLSDSDCKRCRGGVATETYNRS